MTAAYSDPAVIVKELDDWGSLVALPLYGLIVLLLATLALRERE
jgi:hypothetical protein